MASCFEGQQLQGIPPSLKFHGGWKKWRLTVGGTQHNFDNREDAVAASRLVQEMGQTLQSVAMKELGKELSAAGFKTPRKKDEAIQSALRLRYKHGEMACTCCSKVRGSFPYQVPTLIFRFLKDSHLSDSNTDINVIVLRKVCGRHFLFDLVSVYVYLLLGRVLGLRYSWRQASPSKKKQDCRVWRVRIGVGQR